jgi:SAM-dependent methyltransferase
MTILDEPSEYWNDKQVEYAVRLFTRYTLEGGTILVATHDRRMLESSYPRIFLTGVGTRPALSDSRISNSFTPPDARVADKQYMYKTWQDLHERWPRSTLELFENWHENVDNLLQKQANIIATTCLSADYLDLGCGNGLQTLWMRSQLTKCGVAVRATMGIEWQEHAVDWAKYWANGAPDIEFMTADIDLALNSHNIVNCYNVVSSLFVMHDLPKASSHIEQVFSALAEGGIYLACLLNPKWVNQRLDSLFAPDQELPVAHDADFARDYRLPEAPAGDVGLPYFHRSIEWYKAAFERSGFRRVEVAFSEARSKTPAGSTDEPQTVAFLAFK